MAVELNELLKKFNDIGINILAGKKGAESLVTWVHMVENEEIGNFVEAGEIIFTTGIALNEKNTLLKIAKKGVSNRASGFMINIGPYIKVLPQDLIQYCEEHNLTLMSVPWEVNMGNIMRVMTFEISNKSMKKMDIEATLKNAILYPDSVDMNIKSVKNNIVDKNSKFICILIQVENNKKLVSEERLNKMKFIIRLDLEHSHKNTNILSIFNNMVLVSGYEEKRDIEILIERCKFILRTSLKENEEMRFYVGDFVDGLDKLHRSYKEAIKLLHVREYYNDSRDIIHYSDIGFLKLLLEIENKEVLSNYYEESVKPIVEYDNYHQSDLLITLDRYLRTGGSLKTVADEMIVHRNTVNYKLNKVSDLLKCNLSSQETRIKLEMGITVYKLFPEICL